MTTSRSPALALVYACSGSSNVAQRANAIAVRLDRSGLAEMSEILAEFDPLLGVGSAAVPGAAVQ
jgi:uncharacterized metal-binding protein